MTTYVIPCTACGIRMMVTDRRILLCDQCAGEDAQSESVDHIPPWQVRG